MSALLSSIDCFLEFGTGAEFGHAAGGNLDGRAGLRIAAVARLALRDRESSEPDQGNAVPFFQSPGNAVYRGVDGGSRLGLADAAVGSNAVNQVCFVHRSSWGGSRCAQRCECAPSVHDDAVARAWRLAASYLAPACCECQL